MSLLGASAALPQSSNDLHELAEIARNASHPEVSAEIEAVAGTLARREVTIVVLGQFKRGKSTLLNAFAGRNVFPTGILPMTAVATMLVRGAEGARVIGTDGQSRAIPLSEVAEYVSERQNVGNRRGVHQVEISVPLPPWTEGVTFIDSPGVGSPDSANTAAARALLPRADAAIFVLSPDPSITSEEIEFLSEVSAYAAKFFFVLNKVDLVADGERAELERYLLDVLREQCRFPSARIYPLSARAAVDAGGIANSRGWRASGMDALWEELRQFVGTDRLTTLEQIAGVRTRQFCARLDGLIDLALRASSLSETEYARRLASVEKGLAEIRVEQRATQAMLREEVDAAERELPERLRELSRRHVPTATRALTAHLDAIRATGARALVREFEAELRRQVGPPVHEMRESMASLASSRLEAMSQQFGSRLERWNEAMLAIVAQEFGTHLDHLAFTSQLEDARRYSDRVEGLYESTLAGQTVLYLPAGVVRRRLRSQVPRIVEEEFDSQSGRIREDMVDRLERSWKTLSTDVATRLELNVRAIEDAMRQGRERQAADRQGRDRWLAEMKDLRQRIAEIDSRAAVGKGSAPPLRPSAAGSLHGSRK